MIKDSCSNSCCVVGEINPPSSFRPRVVARGRNDAESWFLEKSKQALLFVVAFLVLGISPVAAKDWVIDYDHSKLGFIGTQGDSKFDGGFKKFQATVDFDPVKPETGKITAIIDIASITAGSAERDSYLPQADFFDTAKFPQAVFTSTKITKTGENAYVADGTLTIKGISRLATLPFTLIPEGDHFRAQGKLTLTRTDFHIGEHDWASEAYVKYAVDVVVDIRCQKPGIR